MIINTVCYFNYRLYVSVRDLFIRRVDSTPQNNFSIYSRYARQFIGCCAEQCMRAYFRRSLTTTMAINNPALPPTIYLRKYNTTRLYYKQTTIPAQL